MEETPVADAAKQEVAAEPGGGGGSNKLMMGLLGLNMVVMVAVAAVLFLGQKKASKEETLDQLETAPAGHGAPAAAAGGHGAPAAGGHGEPAAAAEGGGVQARFFNVGDFTANLAGPASTSYVKVTVNFEISHDADEEEMKQRRPQFRDKVISLLNSKKSVDLQSAEGRNYLKEEIKTVANTFVTKGKVEGVYFSAFVIN
jgi:flagellar basal body-associated protein FliL